MTGIPRWGTGTCGVAVALFVPLALAGCDALTRSDQLPPDVTDPAVTQTHEGALQAYRGVTVGFRRAFGGTTASDVGFTSAFVAITGTLTDELQSGHVAAGEAEFTTDATVPIDRRDVPVTGIDETVARTYGALQRVRGQAGQALGLLTDYATDLPVLKAHVYALEGYAEVFLAELFCSGVPLSTLDYHGDYTPRPGSSTTDVLQHAVALFDSALALAGDSASFANLARVGQARALVDLADYAGAAAAANAVGDTYAYKVYFGPTAGLGDGSDDQRNFVASGINSTGWVFSVADREGLRGLDYVSSGDPRTLVQEVGGRKLPQKYTLDGSSPIVVASGLEARLIEAEAALQAKDYDTWRDKLNYVRQTETFWSQIVPNPGGPLATLEDPGAALSGAAADSARVDLMFRERAFWLFLTGHREGDLRRQLRQYAPYWPTQDRLYPGGAYPAGGLLYGSDVTLPIPATERSSNPLFTGCASRGA